MVTQRTGLVGLVFTFSVLFTIVSAQAEVITFQFDVVATSGPLAGERAAGTFAIDSNIIPPGGGQVASLSLFTDVAFTWDGIDYTAANTQTSFLTFDSAGNLVAWDFGTVCLLPTNGGCLVRLPPPGCCRDWVVAQDPSHNHILSFEYGRPDNSFGFGNATVTRLTPVTPPSPVPTLSDAGQIILALLLLMSAVWTLRRLRAGRVPPAQT